MPLALATRIPTPIHPTGSEEAPQRSFADDLVALLPRLRVQALALTRHRPDADDLVQSAISNALAAQASFEPGTNFGAWMYRILRNRFLSNRRRARETVEIDDAPVERLSRPASQEDYLVVQDLRKHLERLPADQRVALIMASVQGLSYAEIAETMGCAVGTAKCRVFRARRQLEVWLLGVEGSRRSQAAPIAAGARRGAARSLTTTASSTGLPPQAP